MRYEILVDVKDGGGIRGYNVIDMSKPKDAPAIAEFPISEHCAAHVAIGLARSERNRLNELSLEKAGNTMAFDNQLAAGLSNDEDLIFELVLENMPHAFVDQFDELKDMAVDAADATELEIGLMASVVHAFDRKLTPLEAFLKYHADGNIATSSELKAFEDLYEFVEDDLHDAMVSKLVPVGYTGPASQPCVVTVRRTAIYDTSRTRLMVPVPGLAKSGQAAFVTIKNDILSRDNEGALEVSIDSWLAVEDFVGPYDNDDIVNEVVSLVK
nr:hypothetical protein [Neorhizobium tomejilense]